MIFFTVVQEFKACFAMSNYSGFDICNMFFGIRKSHYQSIISISTLKVYPKFPFLKSESNFLFLGHFKT